MNIDEFDKLLLTTLDDHNFTRGERQALSQVLADEMPSNHQLALYRHRAFELAGRRIGHGNGVFAWLEEIVKILTPQPPVKPVRSDAYFSPGDDCPGRIVDLIRQARTCIDICVFTITYDKIASAIIAAHNSGVTVRVITDHGKSLDAGSDVERMARAGVNVRLERSDHHMHHKFAIFDRESLLNGSYNWTRGAAINNQENFIITDDMSLVKAFANVFERLWSEYQ